MKFAIPAITAILIAAGCQQQSKPQSTDSAVLDVSPAPAMYAQATPAPMTSAAPDPALNAPSPAAIPAASSNSYTIKKGDTLWAIAASHYGDGKKWHEIADANPGLSPSSLRVGQTITLP